MLLRIALVLLLALGTMPTFGADKPITYESDVKPILRQHCQSCHSSERPRGELDLSTYNALMAGGVSGKSAIAGKPEASPLYTLTAHLEDPKMPPGKPKIPQAQIDTLKAWISTGMIEKTGGVPKTSAIAAAGFVTPITLPRKTAITALDGSTTRQQIAIAGRKQILLYDLNQKSFKALPFPEGEIHSLRYSKDGKQLLAAGGLGGQAGKVVGYDLNTGKRLFTYADETDSILTADLSPDGQTIAYGGPNRQLKLLSATDGKLLHTLKKPTDWVLCTAYSPEGLLVAAGDRFGGLYVVEAKSGKEFAVLRGHTKAVTSIAWRSDSNVLASCSEDGTIRLWDLHTATEIRHWTAHPSGALALLFRTNNQLISAGRDGRLKTWNEAGTLQSESQPTGDAVVRLALAGDTVISGDVPGDVRIWSSMTAPATVVPLPVRPATQTIAAIAVPVPPEVKASPVAIDTRGTLPASDLERKRALLKSVEQAAEQLKEDAARDPRNTALTKAYLQLCEVAVTLKADLYAAEGKSVP